MRLPRGRAGDHYTQRWSDQEIAPDCALAERVQRRKNGFVRVSVTQQGGLLDVAQTVTIVDDVAKRVDGEEVTHERRLDRATTSKLEKLAGRCVTVMTESQSNGSAAGAYDSMTTSVTVDVGGGSHEVTVDSGEEVPAELGQLIDAVLRAPYDPPSGRPRS